MHQRPARVRRKRVKALGERFDQALVLAHDLHRSQRRKDTDIPYISHLLAVAALVIEMGADEDTAIAALLHDAIEDQGGNGTRERLLRLFGERTVGIIDECTDTDQTPKPPWLGRKKRYLNHLRGASPEALMVSLADKLHNARCIRRDLETLGAKIWQRFSGGQGGTIWYYRSLVEIFKEQRLHSQVVAELDTVVGQIEARSAAKAISPRGPHAVRRLKPTRRR